MTEDLSSTNFCENPETEDKLSDQDGGDADGEFEVAGLVMENIHTEERANTSAQQCSTHEGPLRDAAAVISGEGLVLQHKYEGNCIDYDEIQKNEFHVVRSFREVL